MLEGESRRARALAAGIVTLLGLCLPAAAQAIEVPADPAATAPATRPGQGTTPPSDSKDAADPTKESDSGVSAAQDDSSAGSASQSSSTSGASSDPGSVSAAESGSGSGGSGDKNCKDFNSQAEAQRFYDRQGNVQGGDPDDLDRDRDRKACEDFNYGNNASSSNNSPRGGVDAGFGGATGGSSSHSALRLWPAVGGTALAVLSLLLASIAFRRRPE